MATNNQINRTITTLTGTGSHLGSTSGSLITPVLGVASATSLDFTSTAGLIGTTTNDNANAGSVGEYITSSILVGSKLSLSNSSFVNLTSISLTAGDWDVTATVAFEAGATTSSIFQQVSISLTSATITTLGSAPATVSKHYPNVGGFTLYDHCGPVRHSLSGTTTIYLVVVSTFTVSTMDAYGFIGARRVR